MCFTHPAKSTGADHWTLNFNCPPPIGDMTPLTNKCTLVRSVYLTTNDGECNGAHAQHYEIDMQTVKMRAKANDPEL